jgi:hypothetical protein
VQAEEIPLHLDEPVALHPSELGGQRAAVDGEIVRQLLAVEGDREAGRAAPRLASAER